MDFNGFQRISIDSSMDVNGFQRISTDMEDVDFVYLPEELGDAKFGEIFHVCPVISTYFHL